MRVGLAAAGVLAGTASIADIADKVSTIEALQIGIPEAHDPDGDPEEFQRTGFPAYTRRHELVLSHLSVYQRAATPLARREVLLGVCALTRDPPPDVDLGREDYDGEALIRERIEAYVKSLEAYEAKMRLMEEEAKVRRKAMFRSMAE